MSVFLQNALERREAIKVEMDAILDLVTAEKRNDLSDAESTSFDTLSEEARSLDAKIEKFQAQAESDAKLAESRAKFGEVVTPAASGAKVTKEERTYHPEGSFSFVRDAFMADKGDYAAAERVSRHAREEALERRDVATSNFTGLVIPQYLVDLAAPLARAGRPFLDLATNKHELPASGMTLNISRMTTGTSTAVQVTQNDAVSETDADDTLLTIDIRTVAGQQDVSTQALKRGTGVEAQIIADLIKSWHTTADGQCINGAGTAGTVLGLRASGGTAVAFTTTAPTVALLYPKLADAMSIIDDSIYSTPTHWIMTPRRLAWILAAVDTTGRPLAVPTVNGPNNAVSVGAGAMQYGNSGYSILGLPVITDANIGRTYGAGTNQDEIYCVDMAEMHLWEEPGSPFALSFGATNAGNLSTKIVVEGVLAFSAARYPLAASIISGTGLTSPTF